MKLIRTDLSNGQFRLWLPLGRIYTRYPSLDGWTYEYIDGRDLLRPCLSATSGCVVRQVKLLAEGWLDVVKATEVIHVEPKHA